MTYYYNRSEILSFSDLNELQQNDILQNTDIEQAEQDSYVVIHKGPRHIALPLSNFMRHNGKFIHGVFTQTNSSAYTVTISKSNDAAIVAYRG